MPEIWLSAGIEYYSLMHTHVSRSQSGRRERPENDAELQSSKAEAVQRQAPEVTRRQSLVQAKLSVGPADDVYEREADAVADRVVRSLAAPSMMSAAADSGERVRRSAMPVSNITKIAPGAGRVRRFATVGVDGGELDADTDAAISASRGGGKAMGQDVRRKMEGAFGADFGGIRIHEGSKASELNNRIQAKAFTVGNDIYFRDGAPDASSRDGQHLLAHELTHTVQQGGRVQRSTDQIQRIWNPFKKKSPQKPPSGFAAKFFTNYKELEATMRAVPGGSMEGIVEFATSTSYSEENIEFLKVVSDATSGGMIVNKTASQIAKKYIQPGAPRQVNISYQLANQIMTMGLIERPGSGRSPNIFGAAEKEVSKLILTGDMPQYLKFLREQ